MGIPKYTKCYLSEAGHNNFIYPSTSAALLSSDCEFTALSWLGGNAEGLKAVKVLKSCVMPAQIDENIQKNSSPLSKDEYIVVWVSDKYNAP